MVQPLIRTELYHTNPILPLANRGPGTYTYQMNIEGGGLLSTLFVKSFDVGATVAVDWFESTTGEDQGEATLITSHTMPGANLADKITLNNIHNKPRAVVTVAGGSVTFGIYATVYPAGSQATLDLSSELVKNGQISNLVTNLGFTQAIYDPIQGRFFFAQGSSGVQNVYIAGGILAATALEIGGRVSIVTVPSNVWTPLPAIPFGSRKQLNIQNQDTAEVALNYNDGISGYVGMLLAERDRTNYTIGPNIVVYAKAQTGSVSLGVEELA
jgi:hypothetical protein